MPGGFDTPERRQRRADAVSESPVVASSQLLDRRGEPVKRPLEYIAGGVHLEDRSVGPQRRYYRRGIGNGRTALVASAAHIPLNDRRAVESTRRRHQAWQTEAWDYFDEVGEIGYTTSYIANLLSKLRLYPAVEGPTGPVALDAETDGDGHDDARQALKEAAITPQIAEYASATLRRLRSMQGGQSALLRELSLNLEVAGECYIHGHATPRDIPEPGNTVDYGDPQHDDLSEWGTDPSTVEDWNIRSVDELIITGDRFELRLGPGTKVSEPIPETDLVIRIWERHPRFSELATCAMRRVLAEAEALLLLSREIRATSKSRLSNGILLIPSELSFGSVDPTRDAGDGEEVDDPFDAELQEAMITPIQEEGSASAVVPLVLRGPAELLQHVNHLALDKTLDPVLDTRIEQRILRIARGLNMPTEVTTGLMSTTFANAVQVKRSEFEDHIEPRAILICDAITSGYFQWALEVGDGETEGMDPETARKIFVWFDASQLIRVDDQSEQAVSAHQDGVISAEARRRYTGFTEADAPDAAELAARILLKGGRIDPTIFGYLLRAALDDPDMPVPAPPAGLVGIPQSISAMPVPGAPPEEEIKVAGELVKPPPKPEPPPPPVIHVAPAPGQPAEPAPGEKPPTPEAKPPEAAPQTGQNAAPPAVAASAGKHPSGAWDRLGTVLAGIDRDVRARIVTRLDAAMRAALDRAGNRIKAKVQRDKGGGQSALRKAAETVPSAQVAERLGKTVVDSIGLSETDLIGGAFDQTLTDVVHLLDAAYAHAVGAVAKVSGPPSIERRAQMDANHDQNVHQAVSYLRQNLHDLAAARLYSPQPGPEPAGEHDTTVLIPASMVRAAVALAGGQAVKGAHTNVGFGASAWIDLGGAGPVSTPDGQPLGGIGTGPDLMGAVSDAGGSTEGWQWDYGTGVRAAFVPHEQLDGTIVPKTDDPRWANSGTFPATDFYYPGDHDGCVCDITPVIVGPDQSTTTETPEILDQAADEGVQAADPLSDVWNLIGDDGYLTDDSAAGKLWRAASNAQYDAMPQDIADAVDSYTGMGFIDLNGVLRGTIDGTAEDRAIIANVDAAFADHSYALSSEQVLYRGLSNRSETTAAVDAWKAGQVISDPGFVSTTADLRMAERYGAAGTLLRVTTPTGTRYLVGNNGEKELILNRGTLMKIIGIENMPGGKVVDVVIQ